MEDLLPEGLKSPDSLKKVHNVDFVLEFLPCFCKKQLFIAHTTGNAGACWEEFLTEPGRLCNTKVSIWILNLQSTTLVLFVKPFDKVVLEVIKLDEEENDFEDEVKALV